MAKLQAIASPMEKPLQSTLPAATGYHRAPVRIANGALRLLQRVGVGKADLSEESLIRAAREATGLHEFGDESFRVPMRILLRDLEDEADMNPLGRYLARTSLVRILKHRLWAQDLFDRHPEILEREVAPPLVVVGLARSGTTRLHRLLASDRRFLHLKAWETVNPVPWPGSFAEGPDPRIANIDGALKAVLYMSPQIATVHPLGAMEVEEEVGLIEHAFSSQIHEVIHHVPNFAKWLMANDQTYAYEYMLKLLKLIEWFRGDEPGQTWVLKTPQHMQDLDALMRVMPDSRLLCIHRDPIKAVGSACSMAWNAIVRDTDHVDPFWIGQEWCNKTEAMLRKTLRVREEMVPPEQQLDVLYADMNADWRAVMGRIYDFAGMEFTAEAERSMEAWFEENRQHKHGAHKYQLPDFGLEAGEVDSRMRFYRERFTIPYESKLAAQDDA
jgi:hypothetical protein